MSSQELALPIEYTNALCELKTMSNDLLTTGVIRKIGPDFLEISNAMGSSSLKFYVDDVKVVIFHKKLPDRVFVGKLYIPTMDFFRVIDVKSVMSEENRNFFRVNVYLPGKLIIPDEDPESKGVTKEIEVMIVDLSLGGAFITTSEPLMPMTKGLLVMDIDGKEIQTNLVVKRKKELPNEVFGYGCAFAGMKNTVSDAIVKYLFKKQKEIRI